MMKKTILFLLLILICGSLFSQTSAGWRGPGRTGVYLETGLLKEWPDDGPEMIWSIDSLPEGYSSVSILNDKIYLTGQKDSLDCLIALDLNGSLLWETSYGRTWDNSYSLSRCTPTVENDKAYVTSGLGDVACIDANTGELIWTVRASESYGGTFGKWGIAESPLIIDNKLIFTPGGDQTTMIALDKKSGKLIWQTKSLNDNPSYTSPLLVQWMDTTIILQLTESYLFAVEPEKGEIMWTFDVSVFAGGEWKRNNQTNTPVFEDGKIFYTSGYDHRCLQLELSEDADQVYFSWVSDALDVHHGGVVKIGDYLYGANWKNNRMGNWTCIDWHTGEVQYEEVWENKGSIIAADSMLYCYEEKKGNIALVKATPEYFKVISSFKVPLGSGPHWSHPVIRDKVLYIRHGEALMAYSIAAGKP